MLASIHPFGERARHNRWGLTVAFYLAGSALAGLATGAAAGLLGAAVGDAVLSPTVALGVGAALALAAAAVEARRAGRLPGPRRQVNEDWLARYRGWVYGAGFGIQLGTGISTIITTPAVHLTFALALLSGSAAAGAALGLTFGLVRALPILATAGVERPEQLWALHRRIAAQAGTVRRGSAALLGVAALALALTAGLHG